MTKEELKQYIDNNRANYSLQLKRLHPDVYKIIDASYDYSSFAEKLYVHLNGLPKGCEICGKPTVFEGLYKGYRKRCSYKCLHIMRHNKATETRKCVICSKEFEIHKKREKTTCSMECLYKLNATPEVNEKRQVSLKKTMLEKYGVTHNAKLHNFRSTLRKTKLE